MHEQTEDISNVIKMIPALPDQGELGEALSSLPVPDDMPHALPPSHLTDALRFKSIVTSFCLNPELCPMFRELLVYLFYGGVFYRGSSQPTHHPGLLPVAFLFDPKILTFVNRYYPADTGALQRIEEQGTAEEVRNFRRRFAVAGGDYRIPCKMTYYIFKTNDSYVFGRPNPDCETLPDPFPDLFKFISRDLTSRSIDQRYRRFEGQCKHSISLDQLIWVGFPQGFEEAFALLVKKSEPSVPQYYVYTPYPAMRPSEAAAILQNRADEVIRRYMTPGRTQ